MQKKVCKIVIEIGGENMESINFRDKMKEQRKLKGVTQAELAENLGIGQDLYSRYENGKLNFPVVLIPEVCFFLDLTPNELFEYDRYVRLYHAPGSKKGNRRK